MIVFAFPPSGGAQTEAYLLRGTHYEEKTPAGDLLVVPTAGLAPHLPGTPVLCLQDAALGTIVPEALSSTYPERSVWVSSRLSGGTLRARLEAALAQYGARLHLFIEPFCTLFSMPCPAGEGEELTQDALEDVTAQHPVFYSSALCCNYCIAASGGSAGMLLFDTPDTIAQKLALASALGVPVAFGDIPLEAIHGAPQP